MMYNNLIAELRSMVDMLDCQENKDLPIVYSIIRKFKEAASAIENLEEELKKLDKCRHECKIVCLLEEYNKKCMELEQVKRERDAAVEDLTGNFDVCNNDDYCEKHPCWCME